MRAWISYVFVFLFIFSTVKGESPSIVGEEITLEEGDIFCEIKTAKNYWVGDSPSARVKIVNASKQTLYLPGALDGSSEQWRYPYVFFEIVGPENGILEQEWSGRCGNMNLLREKDFVLLKPGKFFNPYQHIDDYGFFYPNEFEELTFIKTGNYRIVFHYSTDMAHVEKWKGTYGNLSQEVLNILRQVPRVNITCSAEVTVSEH